jgi:hypothetical protein
LSGGFIHPPPVRGPAALLRDDARVRRRQLHDMEEAFLWPVPCCARDLAVLMAFAHGRCRHPHIAGSGICSWPVQSFAHSTFEAGTAVSCSVVGAGWPGRASTPI